MKKLILVSCISIILMGCNDPPLPALVKNGSGGCIPSNCAMDYPDYSLPSVQYVSSVVDKHYDSILGHHDFSVEADH